MNILSCINFRGCLLGNFESNYEQSCNLRSSQLIKQFLKTYLRGKGVNQGSCEMPSSDRPYLVILFQDGFIIGLSHF